MFAYELHLDRQAELQRRADDWRLTQQMKAAQAQRRTAARRAAERPASRTDQEPADSAQPARSGSRALRPHRAS